MIYQKDNSFAAFPFKATYDTEESFVVDKTKFEGRLLEFLQREDENATLPEIVYTELSLTQEQQDRLLEVQNTGCNLDDARYYVETGQFPEGRHTLMTLELKLEKEKVYNLQLLVADLLGR